jgi:hypothetical protein
MQRAQLTSAAICWAESAPGTRCTRADRRVVKHCLADRVRGGVVRVVHEDQLPVEPDRPKSGP